MYTNSRMGKLVVYLSEASEEEAEGTDLFFCSHRWGKGEGGKGKREGEEGIWRRIREGNENKRMEKRGRTPQEEQGINCKGKVTIDTPSTRSLFPCIPCFLFFPSADQKKTSLSLWLSRLWMSQISQVPWDHCILVYVGFHWCHVIIVLLHVPCLKATLVSRDVMVWDVDKRLIFEMSY